MRLPSLDSKNVIIKNDKVSLDEFFYLSFTDLNSLLVAVNHILNQNVLQALQFLYRINAGFFYQNHYFLLFLKQCLSSVLRL